MKKTSPPASRTGGGGGAVASRKLDDSTDDSDAGLDLAYDGPSTMNNNNNNDNDNDNDDVFNNDNDDIDDDIDDDDGDETTDPLYAVIGAGYSKSDTGAVHSALFGGESDLSEVEIGDELEASATHVVQKGPKRARSRSNKTRVPVGDFAEDDIENENDNDNDDDNDDDDDDMNNVTNTKHKDSSGTRKKSVGAKSAAQTRSKSIRQPRKLRKISNDPNDVEDCSMESGTARDRSQDHGTRYSECEPDIGAISARARRPKPTKTQGRKVSAPVAAARSAQTSQKVDQVRRDFSEAMRAVSSANRRAKSKDTDGRAVLSTALSMLDRMRAAAQKDRAACETGKPSAEKLLVVPHVEQILLRPEMQDIMLENGLADVLRIWLEPLPDRQLPLYEVRHRILKLLLKMQIDTYTLISSRLGRVVYFYSRLARESPDLRRMASDCVVKWSRPILRKADSYRSIHHISSSNLQSV